MTIARILAIETSCDDTAVALYHAQHGLLAHRVASQCDTHQPFGGVVPELASRDHMGHLLPLVHDLLQAHPGSLSDIDGVVYTQGPGLMGALLVGATFARALAWTHQVPSLGVNHLEGHLMAVMLEAQSPPYPFLSLLVSGGHTMLVHVHEFGRYQVLGQTRDDAAGEAFDKTAKIMGHDYPGGPAIARLAAEGSFDPDWVLPRPMLGRGGLDLSFSGLKTRVRQHWERSGRDDTAQRQLAYACQEAIVAILVQKTQAALRQTDLKHLTVVGGVGANLRLRQAMADMAQEHDVTVCYPRLEFCTDNAAMIAYAGMQRLARGQRDDPTQADVKARWPLSDLSP